MVEEHSLKEREIEEDTTPQMSYVFSTEAFRRSAVDQMVSPDELDTLFQPVTIRTKWGWLGLIFLTLSFLIWLFVGSIPIAIEGLGIVFYGEGVFTIQSNTNGKLVAVFVQPGNYVEKDAPVVEIKEKNKRIKIKSPYAGQVLKIFKPPGSYLQKGLPLISLEYFEKEDSRHVIYAFIPIESSKQIALGMKVEVELSSAKVGEFGAIEGKVIQVSPYAISHEYIESLIQNEGLVTYLTQGKQTVAMLTIEPELDASTPSGYKWTSGKGPNLKISTGTIVKIKGLVGHIQPLYYFLPLWRLAKAKGDIQSWWDKGS